MNVPGLSLFQGADSIQLNTSAQQRIEEEDALEDQLRRNEELRNELQNAFDDLDDTEDEDGMGESRNSTELSLRMQNKIPTTRHNGGMFHTARHANPNPSNRKNGQFMNEILNGEITTSPKCNVIEHEQMLTEMKYLKNALSSREEEIKNITSLSSTERVKLEAQIAELKKRLSISEAEKERAHMNRKQTHELVVESKQQIAEHESQMAELNVKIKTLDASNLELLGELERARTMLADVQHKYHMVERNAGTNADKHADAVVRQLNERHAAQADMLQQQLNTMNTKLDSRDNELKRLQVQYNELQGSRDALLIDKSDTINRLTQQLEVAQRQCQNIMTNSSSNVELEQEVLKLRRLVTASEQQMNSMQRTISNLTSRLESTTAELELMTDSAIYEDTTSQNSNNMQTPVARPKDGFRKRTTIGSSSTPIVVEDRLQRLKQEFNRCLADQREKRTEILHLKEQITEKNDEIQQLKLDENKALVERNTSKELAERLASKLKLAESELGALKRNSMRMHANQPDGCTPMSANCNCDDLKRSLDEVQSEKEQLELNVEELNEMNAKLTEQLENRDGAKCAEEEKQQSQVKDSQDECYHLKNLYMALSSEKDDLVRELAELNATDLHKDLREQKSKVASLERALSVTEQKCNEISKLLEKERQDAQQKLAALQLRNQSGYLHDESQTTKRITSSCTKCIDLSTKVAQVEIENLQIQTSCSNYLREIHDLKRSLKKSERLIADLEKQSILKVEHDQLIEEMKKKAEQLEQFMINNNITCSPKRPVETDTPPSTDRTGSHQRDQCVSTEDLLNNNKSASPNSNSDYRAVEKRIREDMSRVMATKIKSYENQLKENARQFEDQIKSLSDELLEAQAIVRSRDNDISALKQCILSERATIRNVLDNKDQEAEMALEKQKDMLVRGRDQLQAAHQQIEHLSLELDDSNAQMMAERQSMNKLMAQWNSERNTFLMREEELKEQMAQRQQEFDVTTYNLKEKIVSAKKTAANYKKYSEDKERHIQKESERIKLAYEAAVQKAKDNMTHVLKEQEKEANRKIAELQSKYEASLTTNSDHANRVTSSISSSPLSRNLT